MDLNSTINADVNDSQMEFCVYKTNEATTIIILNGREPKIILDDIMKPRVLLERIDWPPSIAVSQATTPCSSEFDGFFAGFDSCDDEMMSTSDSDSDDAYSSSISTLSLDVCSDLDTNELRWTDESDNDSSIQEVNQWTVSSETSGESSAAADQNGYGCDDDVPHIIGAECVVGDMDMEVAVNIGVISDAGVTMGDADAAAAEIPIDGGSDSSWNSDVERFSIAASSDDNESECEQTLKCNETLNESPEHDDDDDEEDAASQSMADDDGPLLTDILEMIIANGADNRTENGERIASIHLFENICIRNLKECCYDIFCRFNHTMPTVDTVLYNLETAAYDEVIEAYTDLLLVYSKLFDQYFPTFCSFFGKRKIRTQLRDMSHLCMRSEHAKEFMQEIVNGLCVSGVAYSTTVNVLIKQLTVNDYDQHYQMLILYVAMNWDNAELMQHLRQFQRIFMDENWTGQRDVLDKLIRLNLEKSDEVLVTFTIDTLKRCSVTTYLRTNGKRLQQFLVDAVKSGHLDGQNILRRIAVAAIKL